MAHTRLPRDAEDALSSRLVALMRAEFFSIARDRTGPEASPLLSHRGRQEIVRHQRLAVIGGGVTGCSVLYHLAKAG